METVFEDLHEQKSRVPVNNRSGMSVFPPIYAAKLAGQRHRNRKEQSSVDLLKLADKWSKTAE
uniref:Uncharacterized protein n=1 Tax=Tetraselmis sp. GSL018 TaxID=582737 RepID=A0A061RMZ2_9CHLO